MRTLTPVKYIKLENSFPFFMHHWMAIHSSTSNWQEIPVCDTSRNWARKANKEEDGTRDKTNTAILTYTKRSSEQGEYFFVVCSLRLAVSYSAQDKSWNLTKAAALKYHQSHQFIQYEKLPHFHFSMYCDKIIYCIDRIMISPLSVLVYISWL